MHIFSRLLAVLLLSACASNPTGPALQTLEGKNIRIAIDYLGYPDDKQEILGDMVYSWIDEGTYTSTYPISGTDYGRFEIDGRRGTYENRRQTYVSEVSSFKCEIRMVTTDQDIIKHSELTSIGEGCYRYHGAFRKILDDYNVSPADEADLLEKQAGTL